MASIERHCTLLLPSDGQRPTQKELKQILQKGSDEEKYDTMRTIIRLHLNGENQQQLLMTVIQYVVPSKFKPLKKLALMFWEIVEKTGKDGKLLPELILVCSHLRSYLEHPNEYIRGSTLRFICKVREIDILSPLIGPIVANLENRHSYVRRNAVLAVHSICTINKDLIPDASELIFDVLQRENDSLTKRNAFVMLFECDQAKAVIHLRSILGKVSSMGDSYQLIVLNLLRKMCKAYPGEKNNFLNVIIQLMETKSASVMFQCASTLVLLSSSPAAIKHSAQCYIRLLTEQQDSNVKLIILDKLNELKQQFHYQMQQQSEIVTELLRAMSLSTTGIGIKHPILELVLDITTQSNVDLVITHVKKELSSTESSMSTNIADRNLANAREDSHGGGNGAQSDYRRLLVQALHRITTKFPDHAGQHALTVMDYLSDQSAGEVILFVREVMESNPKMRDSILDKLFQKFNSINQSKVYRGALWIMSEYTETNDQILSAFNTVKDALGEDILLFPVSQDDAEMELELEHQNGLVDNTDNISLSNSAISTSTMTKSAATTLRADGTYATMSATDLAPMIPLGDDKKAKDLSLNGYVQDGGFFLSSVISTTLLKLVMKFHKKNQDDTSEEIVQTKNKILADAAALTCALLRLGASETTQYKMDKDTYLRICLCIKILLALNNPESGDEQVRKSIEVTEQVLFQDARETLQNMLRERSEREATQLTKASDGSIAQPEKKDGTRDMIVPVDQQLSFFHLKPGVAGSRVVDVYEFEDLEVDEGKIALQSDNAKSNRLSRVVQLTGFSDTVYAEALISINQYDISLDILIINQTSDTLQNLALELFTVGDLKLVERPQEYTLGPSVSVRVKTNIKVSSTDTGVIFGNITYDVSGGKYESQIVSLNDVQINIMEYIKPAYCRDLQFRSMWFEFEWENKISVKYDPAKNEKKTNMTNHVEGAQQTSTSTAAAEQDKVALSQYLSFITDTTNMQVLTSGTSEDDQCGFLSANLYARSTFGEDALANVSIEYLDGDVIEGFVRIRSKSQGIALALGNLISKEQKNWNSQYKYKNIQSQKQKLH